ncbi:MAG: DegT/DnrJ/EryC1/StrS aminotransferase family protein [Campylobacteraceae bacterium]|nr:DegT/DnrJ/EryC1/StrS aminotransferase family protein [Campylobacteraceae bacterium]
MKIPFFQSNISPKQIELVNEVLSTNSTCNMAEKLEEQMQKYIGSTYALSTNNATAAMHLTLCAMDLKRGDKILCSVNSFPSVAEVVRHFDAEPIFVDIDSDDFNIDINCLEKALQTYKHKKLKCAFIGHMAGQTADMDSIYALAEKYNIKIIDEASNALGGSYKGVKLGSHPKSHATCFKFSPQIQTTMASGGMVVTEDEELYEKAKLLRNHGIKNEDWDEYGNIGYIYDVLHVGMKYNMPELSAAFNVGKLLNIDKLIKRRQEIAKIYDTELANCPHVSTPVKKREHIYEKYIIKIDKNRDHFARQLNEKGVCTKLHFVPLHLLNYYKNKYSLKVNDFPVALTNYQQILSIPIYSNMSDDMVLYVCDSIKKIAKTSV